MTTLTDEVRAETESSKFGGDRMATLLWILSLDSMQDEETGDASEWHFWVARFGKRLLVCDTVGFVSCTRFDSEAECKAAFDKLDAEYSAVASE